MSTRVVCSLADRVAAVRQQIAERRAVIAKATLGPWHTFPFGSGNASVRYGTASTLLPVLAECDANFIVASRNERDAELLCLDTMLEGLLRVYSNEPPGNAKHDACTSLTTLFDQWEEAKKRPVP